MNATETATAHGVEFTDILGDEYEKHVEVTVDGHAAGEIYLDDDDDRWSPSPMLVREMESLNGNDWGKLEDAKDAITAAASVFSNRCARLREQRRRLAAAG